MQSESSSRQDGTSAWIYDYKPTVQEQKWIIKTATGGGYEFITKPSSSTSAPKALEIANSSKANGAKAQIWTASTNRTNDNWNLISVYSRQTNAFQSARAPGKMEDGKLAKDMFVGGLDLSTLDIMNQSLGNLARVYNGDFVLGHEKLGPQALKDYMYDLAIIFTANNPYMNLVAKDMIKHFLGGTGNDYRNNTLTGIVSIHPSTQKYIKSTKDIIISYLKKNPGLPDRLSLNQTFKEDMAAIQLPQYPASTDLFTGLTICLNGTWGAKIEIKDYEYDGKNFKGKLHYTIYDHFGLDGKDVTDSSWFSGILGYTREFGSWYVLQRYEGCNGKYKPFVTYIEFDVSFNG